MLSTFLRPFFPLLEQGATRQRTFAAKLQVWVVTLLLILMAPAHGIHVENSVDTVWPMESNRASMDTKKNLFVSIYLNGTEYSSESNMTETFALALLLDLYETIFPQFQLSDKSVIGEQDGFNAPQCSLRKIGDFHPPANILFCFWQPYNESLVNLSLYHECRSRVHDISKSGDSKDKNLFLHSSEVYRIMTGDPRHLAAVGGDCNVRTLGLPESMTCGKLPCWALSVIIISSCAVVLLVSIMVYVLCKRYRCRMLGLCAIPSASPAPQMTRPELSGATEYKMYNSWAHKTGVKEKEDVIASSPYNRYKSYEERSQMRPSFSFQPLVHADVRSEEGTPIDIGEYLVNKGNYGASARSSVSVSQGSYAAQSVRGSNKLRDSASARFRSLGTGNESNHTPVTPNELSSVDLSVEEREQLQRQCAWLSAHVTGLDAL